MSTADIIIIVILILGAYGGYKKGLILEVIAIAAFILAILGGFKLLHVGMEYLSKVYEGFGNLLPFVAFLVLFVIILIVVNMAGQVVKKIIDWTPFGVFDNVAGAIVGVLKWAFILSIFLWVSRSLEINLPDSMTDNSKFLPLISGFAGWVSDFISTIFPSFDNFISTLEELFQSFSS